jgi:hypothetical protein
MTTKLSKFFRDADKSSSSAAAREAGLSAVPLHYPRSDCRVPTTPPAARDENSTPSVLGTVWPAGFGPVLRFEHPRYQRRSQGCRGLVPEDAQGAQFELRGPACRCGRGASHRTSERAGRDTWGRVGIGRLARGGGGGGLVDSKFEGEKPEGEQKLLFLFQSVDAAK